MTADKSFSKRLSLNVLFLTSILFVLAILVAAISSHKLISEEAAKSASNMLDAVSNQMQIKLSEVESAVRNLAWIASQNIDDEQALYDITARMVDGNPSIVGSAIAFPEGYHNGERFFSPYSYRDQNTGLITSTQLGNDNYDYFYMDWYLIPSLQGKPFWSEPYYDEGGGEQYMSTYSYPILDSNGNTLAVVTADINLDWLSELVSQIRPYDNSFMFMVTRTGSFVATEEIDSLKGETLYSLACRIGNESLIDISRAMLKGEKGMKRYFYDGQLSFVVYGPLENGWSAAISCRYKEVLARTSQMHVVLIMIGAIGLFLLFISCYLTVKRLTHPLVEFSDAAMSIAQGNFNTRLPIIKYDDEIGKLRNSFDYMQKSLFTYIDELKATTSAKERFESELNIARQIQMHMVPGNFPCNAGFDLYAMIQPAKEVGGDLYDFFVKDRKLLFTIGDVSGKGVPASLFMAITRSAFRFIAGLDLPIDEIVSNINNSVSNGNDTGMFVTMFAACLDLDTGEMEYCNAGHNRIVVKNPDGSARFLDQTANLAIGVFDGFRFKRQQTTVGKGSRLILYTDGVTEAEAADKSQFGDQALLSWAQNLPADMKSKDATDDLLANVKKFTGGNEQNDDITIMVIGV